MRSHSSPLQGIWIQFLRHCEGRIFGGEAPKLEEWLHRGYQGKMGYLENHFDKRLDPRCSYGSKISHHTRYNYFPARDLAQEHALRLQNMLCEDYHTVVKDRLYALFARFQEQTER